jgi:parallel beta-helix repeat protein
MAGLGFKIQTAKANGTIYIKADGSIDPPTPLIERQGNDTYILTDNITTNANAIVIERDNMTLDGAGHLIKGEGSQSGILVSGRHGLTIKNLSTETFDYGINLFNCSVVDVFANNISTTKYNGIWIYSSSRINVHENKMARCEYYGIGLDISTNNTLNENEVTRSNGGIYLDWSKNNTLVGNNVTGSTLSGIRLQVSPNNKLRDNIATGNLYNFEVFGENLPHFMNDIDTSNVVDGKPVYYLVNEHDINIPTNAGFVALINCTRMSAKNLSLTKNGRGVLLAATTNSTIINNIIHNDYEGITLIESFSNKIADNSITLNNYHGVELTYSSGNSISTNTIEANALDGVKIYYSDLNNIRENQITRNYEGVEVYGLRNLIFGNKISDNSNDGISIYGFSNNTVVGNTIANNSYGLKLFNSANNKIYNNNFKGNLQNAYSNSPNYANLWDSGIQSGGNYWSGYANVDSNHDGISDIEYEVDSSNVDKNPLMGSFQTFNTSLNYYIDAVSNSTIQNFEYFEMNKTITMYVSNSKPTQTYGFCRMAIPNELMNASTISVVVDGNETAVLNPNYNLHNNGTYVWIYFEYKHSTHRIDIMPEFSSIVIMPLFLMATLIAVVFRRRKRQGQNC